MGSKCSPKKVLMPKASCTPKNPFVEKFVLKMTYTITFLILRFESLSTKEFQSPIFQHFIVCFSTFVMSFQASEYFCGFVPSEKVTCRHIDLNLLYLEILRCIALIVLKSSCVFSTHPRHPLMGGSAQGNDPRRLITKMNRPDNWRRGIIIHPYRANLA